MEDLHLHCLTVEAALRRTGMETRLLVDGSPGHGNKEPDRSLLRLLGQARQFNDMLMTGRATTVRDLSAKAGVSPSYFARVLRLSFLAPDITGAILRGRQPVTLTAKSFLDCNTLDPDWSRQGKQLGFT